MSGTEARHNDIAAAVDISTVIRHVSRIFSTCHLQQMPHDRRRFWTPQRLIVTLIVMALYHGQIPLNQRWGQARTLIGSPHYAKTYQGFVKAIRQFGQPMLAQAIRRLQQLMIPLAQSHQLCQGLTPIAIDGSRFALPRTPANEQTLGNNNQPKAEPQAWVTLAYQMTLGLPWCWQTGPADASERQHLLDMRDQLPADALIVADAGFHGYDVFRQIIDSNRHLLMRVGANVTLLKKLRWAFNITDQTVDLWPAKQRQAGEHPLTLRLIKVAAVGRGRRPMYLLTSVLDPSRLSDEQATVLYRMRWGVEVCYRQIKQTLAHRRLHSHAPENVAWELQGILLGLMTLGLVGRQGHRSPRPCPVKLVVSLGVKGGACLFAGPSTRWPLA